MTCEEYINKIRKLQNIYNKIQKAEDVLDIDFLCGPFGDLFDFAYDLMIPAGSPDKVYETFGRIVFEQDFDDEDIADFYISLFEGE